MNDLGTYISSQLQKLPTDWRALVCAIALVVLVGIFNKKAALAVLALIAITWLSKLAAQKGL